MLTYAFLPVCAQTPIAKSVNFFKFIRIEHNLGQVSMRTFKEESAN